MERLFVATVFKSGTKLLEHILGELTGMSASPIGMEAGCDYESADPIVFEPNRFFLWHNVPSPQVQERIRAKRALPVFLIRNIYDLAVSQYYHFADDVDAAIGHSTGTRSYFSNMSRDEGLSVILCGVASEYFTWHGFAYYLRQIQEILKFSKTYPCHVICYERLALNKRQETERLAEYLSLDINQEMIDGILEKSSLEAMRKARMENYGDGKHFRKGVPGDHMSVLKSYHYDMIGHLKLAYAPALDRLCEELEFNDVTAARPCCPDETEDRKAALSEKSAFSSVIQPVSKAAAE